MTYPSPDNHFAHPTLAAVYDVTCGWSEDRDFYRSLAGQDPITVLDVGCGTGLLCNAYAETGHEVVGVDPSPAMLEVARGQPYGAQVEWILGWAQNFETVQRFDLAIMTGHAFQTLLTTEDMVVALENIAAHLRPNGRFVFESRNPAIDWAERWNHQSKRWNSKLGSFTQSTRVISSTSDTVSFEHIYEFDRETLTSQSELWFPSMDVIERNLAKANLQLSAVYGDWDQSRFHPSTSLEMIFDTNMGI